MSRAVASQLFWNYGLGRMASGRVSGLYSRRFLNANHTSLCKQIVLVNYRDYSSRQPLPSKPEPPSILPKITALLNETNKFTPASKAILDNGKSLFRRQWDAFFNWYDEISHTNEVRIAHKQVEDLQDKLNQAQQLRRDVSKELNDIRYELQVCYADQANCQKGDPRYLEMIRREIEVNIQQK